MDREEAYKVSYSGNKIIVTDVKGKYKIDLEERLLQFSVKTLKFLMKFPVKKELDVIKYQLSKSATSVGANYKESQASTSNEFLQRMRIALREANESNYWYTIIDELKLGDEKHRLELLDESHQIALILGSIASKLDRKRRQNNVK